MKTQQFRKAIFGCVILATAMTVGMSDAQAQTTFECVVITSERTVRANESFTASASLWISDGPIPCGGFMSEFRPSWGGIRLGPYQEFVAGDDWYDSDATLTAPSSPGSYSYRVTCIVDLYCDGRVVNPDSITVPVRVVGGSGGGDPSDCNPRTDIEFNAYQIVSGRARAGEEFCFELRICNDGDGLCEIDTIDLDRDSGPSVIWSDDDETGDEDLSPGDCAWVGDPFCATADAAGSLWVDIDVESDTDGDWYNDVDDFYIDIEEDDPCAGVTCADICSGSSLITSRTCSGGSCGGGSGQSCAWGCSTSGGAHCNTDPCAGVTCPDRCSGSIRQWGGVPVASGATCSCSYETTDCNVMDVTGSEVLYCSGGNVRGHRSRTDYSCSGGSCTSSTGWVSDRPVDNCGGRGCITTGGAHCNPPDSCAGVTCPDYCAGNTLWQNGRTVIREDGTCECQRDQFDCSSLDNVGAEGQYCCGEDVCSRELQTQYTCSAGLCEVGETRWVNERVAISCSAMDTEPETFPYCAGDNLRGVDRFMDYTCNPERVACEGEARAVNDRLFEHCPYSCADAVCLECVPEWVCDPWTECDGPVERTRVCWDFNDCGIEEGAPSEAEPCACELESVAWSTDEAVDGETVQLAIATRGACAGQCLPYELLEVDWPEDADFWFLRDDIVREGEYCLDRNDGIVVDWLARFIPQRWDGFNEFRMRIRFRDSEEETRILRVEPRRDYLGELRPILEENTFVPASPSDYLCFHGAAVTITPTCVEWWDQAGEYAEAAAFEDLETLLEIFVGATMLEVVWNAACTLCAIPAVHVGAVSACAASGIGCLLIPLDVGVCGIACLDLIAQKIVRTARLVWRRFLGDWLERFRDDVGARAWEVVRTQADEAGAYALLRNERGETWDLWTFVDPSDSSRVVSHGVSNSIRHYTGGGNFLRYRRATRQGDEVLFNYEKEAFTPGPNGEFELLGQFFQDDEFVGVWESSLQDLAGVDDARELVDLVEFQSVVSGVADSILAPQVFAGTVWQAERGRNRIVFGLRALREVFEGRARLMALHRAVAHELGHAAANHMLVEQGYTLTSRGVRNEAALEVLNDVFVLRGLREEEQGLFYSTTREWLEGSYRNQRPGDEFHYGRRVANRFVDAVRRGALDSRNAWELVSFKTYADEFGIPALSTDIGRDLTDALARESDEVRDAARALLRERSEQLRADAAIYAEHLRDAAPTRAFDDIVCRRYRIVTNCMFADDASAVVEGDSVSGDSDFNPEPLDCFSLTGSAGESLDAGRECPLVIGEGEPCVRVCFGATEKDAECSFVRGRDCADLPGKVFSCTPVDCEEVPEITNTPQSGCECGFGRSARGLPEAIIISFLGMISILRRRRRR